MVMKYETPVKHHIFLQVFISMVTWYHQRNVRQFLQSAYKAQFGYLRESCQYVVAFTRFAGGGIWLHQESLRHILAYHGYVHGTIAVNITWMERGFIAGQTHRSMYTNLFNRLRAIDIGRKLQLFPTPCI